eukprot:NODE_4411_length_805_cov_2.907407_g3656_i0.p2 GENE.NODE_4411_length_805_cov_2.907407_g3656_i0~~NODE_4411_length_805_cov_2.907407_g3656_i0.p2  ORF type:complete len:185 (+),score=34.71 NODE_4411_length_805_cov_2.907407_g3656_i0:207-761(+)
MTACTTCYNPHPEAAKRPEFPDYSPICTCDPEMRPPLHPLFDKTNDKQPGYFKFESGAVPIVEAVGLCPKMYQYLKANEVQDGRAKGVKRANTKRLRVDDYINALDGHVFSMTQTRFASRNHVLETVTQKKVALQAFNNKAFILEDGIHSLSHGHHRIEGEVLAFHDSMLDVDDIEVPMEEDEA